MTNGKNLLEYYAVQLSDLYITKIKPKNRTG